MPDTSARSNWQENAQASCVTFAQRMASRVPHYPRMAAGELQFGLVWPSRHRHQQCLTAVSALAS
jgi:hypothetical protein